MKKAYSCTYLIGGAGLGLLLGTLISKANAYLAVSIGALCGSLIDLLIYYKKIREKVFIKK